MNSLQQSMAIQHKSVTFKSLVEKIKDAQREEGDCLKQEFVSTLPEKVHLRDSRIATTELARIWEFWALQQQEVFREKFGDIALLLNIEVDLELIRAMIQFWDPSYRCFVFNEVDMVPTIEEYSVLLHLESSENNKVYVKTNDGYRKELAALMGISTARVDALVIKRNEKTYLPWRILKDFIHRHPNDNKGLEAMALAIYGLVIFPGAEGLINADIINFLKQLVQKAHPVPAILAETIRSLNFIRRKGKGRFNGCLQLLYVWMKSHFPCKSSLFRSIFFDNNSPLQEFRDSKWPECRSKQEWTVILGTLTHVDVIWRAPWMPHYLVLASVGGKFWIPLMGIWGAVSYSPLLVLRQLGHKQHVPCTSGLNLFEFDYTGDGIWRKIERCAMDWRQTIKIVQEPFEDDFTESYLDWRSRRVNDTVLPKMEIPTARRPQVGCKRKEQDEKDVLIAKIPELEDGLVKAEKKICDLTSHLQKANQYSERKSLEIIRLEEVNKELKAQTRRYEDMYLNLGRDYEAMSENYHFLESLNSRKDDVLEGIKNRLSNVAAEATRMNEKIETLRNDDSTTEEVGAKMMHLLEEIQQHYKIVMRFPH